MGSPRYPNTPWSLTWNLKISPLKRRLFLETIIFRLFFFVAHSLATIYWKAMEFQQHLFCSGVHASSWSWCSCSKAQFTVLSLWREIYTARYCKELATRTPQACMVRKIFENSVLPLVLTRRFPGFWRSPPRFPLEARYEWRSVQMNENRKWTWNTCARNNQYRNTIWNTIRRCCRGIPLNGNLVYEHKPWRIWSHHPGLELGTDQFGRSKSTAVRIYKAVDWMRRYNI